MVRTSLEIRYVLDENHLPSFLIGEQTEVRRGSRKYARRVLRTGAWVPDDELLRPVPLAEVEFLQVSPWALPSASMARLVVFNRVFEEMAVDFELAAEKRGAPLVNPALIRRLALEGIRSFWFALVALDWAADRSAETACS